jgi:hypothetical protein
LKKLVFVDLQCEEAH